MAVIPEAWPPLGSVLVVSLLSVSQPQTFPDLAILTMEAGGGLPHLRGAQCLPASIAKIPGPDAVGSDSPFLDLLPCDWQAGMEEH